MFSNFLRHWKMIIIFLVTFLIVISPMVININTLKMTMHKDLNNNTKF